MWQQVGNLFLTRCKDRKSSHKGFAEYLLSLTFINTIDMEETVKDRLMLFIKEKGLSQKRFEE
ncbi:MAG: hypothetical protein ACOCN7_08360, partial [Prevotella sp.]